MRRVREGDPGGQRAVAVPRPLSQLPAGALQGGAGEAGSHPGLAQHSRAQRRQAHLPGTPVMCFCLTITFCTAVSRERALDRRQPHLPPVQPAPDQSGPVQAGPHARLQVQPGRHLPHDGRHQLGG